ncbi:MAG: hypothetical protein KDC05_13570 [Bacteroidales bacterium]|nr:hypothetical protein [Bacteroidales bacterium]
MFIADFEEKMIMSSMKLFYFFCLAVLIPCMLKGQTAGKTSDDPTYVKISIWLEGPYKQGKMNTDLNKSGYLPTSQPFNVSPWNYDGTESVPSIPNGNVVDWVLVELRSADSASAATPETVLVKKAAFLMSNGKILETDGVTLLNFDTVFT